MDLRGLKLLWWHVKASAYSFLLPLGILLFLYDLWIVNNTPFIGEAFPMEFNKIFLIVYVYLSILAFFIISYRKINGFLDLVRPMGITERSFLSSSTTFLFLVAFSLLLPAYASYYHSLEPLGFKVPASLFYLNFLALIVSHVTGLAGLFKLLDRTRISIGLAMIVLLFEYAYSFFQPGVKHVYALFFPAMSSAANFYFFARHSVFCTVPFIWAVLGVIAWWRSS